MGLASSQARLLQLTTRMHQIEYKAAKLEAEKLQMANESKRVYDEYNAALEDTKIQYKTINTDGSFTYNDIRSYEDFLNAGFAIDFRGTVYDGGYQYRNDEGKRITIEKITEDEYVTQTGETPPPITDGITMPEYYTEFKYYKITDENGTVNYTYNKNSVYTDNGPVFVDNDDEEEDLITFEFDGSEYSRTNLNYAQLCADVFKADINNPPTDVSEVITNLINSGFVTIVERRKDQTFAKESDIDFDKFETSVPTNTGLQEVADEKNLRKAEAKYEADMRKIDFKDRTFDRELAAIEQERNAIKNEMETLKTVAKDNVERTFKLFG